MTTSLELSADVLMGMEHVEENDIHPSAPEHKMKQELSLLSCFAPVGMRSDLVALCHLRPVC